MIASVFGIMFSSYAKGGEKRPYNGYEFQRTNQGWFVKINGQKYEFQYHPADLEAIQLDPKTVDALKGSKVLAITFNPNSKNIKTIEATRYNMETLLSQTGIYTLTGTLNKSKEYALPIITCQNATIALPVIKLEENIETNITTENHCITIQADRYELPAITERMIYVILGIMDQ